MTPLSDETAKLLYNVQNYDTQMQGFFDMQHWDGYPTTVTPFNTVPPILQRRNLSDANNLFVDDPRIEYSWQQSSFDAQTQAAPENEIGTLLLEGQDERVQSCYSCCWSTCEKTCETTSSLHNHVKEHIKATEAPDRCLWLGCAKGSLTISRLNKHIQLHTKPFACPICDHCSATTRDSRRHTRKHGLRAGDLIYYCPIRGCEYGQGGSQNPFKRLDHAKRHIHRQHSQTVDPIRGLV